MPTSNWTGLAGDGAWETVGNWDIPPVPGNDVTFLLANNGAPSALLYMYAQQGNFLGWSTATNIPGNAIKVRVTASGANQAISSTMLGSGTVLDPWDYTIITGNLDASQNSGAAISAFVAGDPNAAGIVNLSGTGSTAQPTFSAPATFMLTTLLRPLATGPAAPITIATLTTDVSPSQTNAVPLANVTVSGAAVLVDCWLNSGTFGGTVTRTNCRIFQTASGNYSSTATWGPGIVPVDGQDGIQITTGTLTLDVDAAPRGVEIVGGTLDLTTHTITPSIPTAGYSAAWLPGNLGASHITGSGGTIVGPIDVNANFAGSINFTGDVRTASGMQPGAGGMNAAGHDVTCWNGSYVQFAGTGSLLCHNLTTLALVDAGIAMTVTITGNYQQNGAGPIIASNAATRVNITGDADVSLSFLQYSTGVIVTIGGNGTGLLNGYGGNLNVGGNWIDTATSTDTTIGTGITTVAGNFTTNFNGAAQWIYGNGRLNVGGNLIDGSGGGVNVGPPGSGEIISVAGNVVGNLNLHAGVALFSCSTVTGNIDMGTSSFDGIFTATAGTPITVVSNVTASTITNWTGGTMTGGLNGTIVNLTGLLAEGANSGSYITTVQATARVSGAQAGYIGTVKPGGVVDEKTGGVIGFMAGTLTLLAA